jgi:hypothetical protein
MAVHGLDNELMGREGAKKHLGYLEEHRNTPRALCLVSHIVVLYHLAGLSVQVVRREQGGQPEHVDVLVCREDLEQWFSLHGIGDFETLLARAYARFNNGEIGEDWFDVFQKDLGI